MNRAALWLPAAASARANVRRAVPITYRRAWCTTGSGRLGIRDRVGLFAEFAGDGQARPRTAGTRDEISGFVTRIESGSVRLAGAV